uniref:Uncharacterized protein n=1 Tax=Syphacia muris TaxID=451379 RepID=A0A0N5AYJ0_9BILA
MAPRSGTRPRLTFVNYSSGVRCETVLRKAIFLQRVMIRGKEISSFELKRKAEVMLIREAQNDVTRAEIERWEDEDGVWRLSGRFELQLPCDDSFFLYLGASLRIALLSTAATSSAFGIVNIVLIGQSRFAENKIGDVTSHRMLSNTW